MALIEATGIQQTYDGRDVLKNVSLSLDKPEVLALIGPTGAGKTTLFRILDLIEPPRSGKLLFDGVDVTARGARQLEARRRISYVQQRPLVFAANVYDNVACGLKWRHLASDFIKRKTQEALELVGMTGYRDRNARMLSGGETQRIAIARALVTEPEVLLLDEPTANMDPVSTAKIEEVLSRIISEQKTAIVMTTHNMSQGQRMANRLGVLIDGELLQTGTVNDIFNRPRNKKVAEFVGVENILKGVIEDKDRELARIAVGGETISAISDLSVGETVYVLIRPEVIVFSLTAEGGSARNVFKSRVTRINTLGSTVRIEADCGFPIMAVITTQAAQDLNVSIGGHIYASFKATAIHVIKRWH